MIVTSCGEALEYAGTHWLAEVSGSAWKLLVAVVIKQSWQAESLERALRNGVQLTNKELRESTHLPSNAAIRSAADQLVEAGLVERFPPREGGAGLVYRLQLDGPGWAPFMRTREMPAVLEDAEGRERVVFSLEAIAEGFFPGVRLCQYKGLDGRECRRFVYGEESEAGEGFIGPQYCAEHGNGAGRRLRTVEARQLTSVDVE